MDYFLIALGGFLVGVYVQTLARPGSRPRRRAGDADRAARQAEAFLRGLKAFEKGVAAQLERDRRSVRMRRWIGRRSRVE
jgi:hypothetical protein